jgi:hypothetical protein
LILNENYKIFNFDTEFYILLPLHSKIQPKILKNKQMTLIEGVEEGIFNQKVYIVFFLYKMVYLYH